MNQKSIILSALFAAALLLLVLPAAAESNGDFKYALNDDGTVKITQYTGRAAELKIPAKLDGKKVTVIGKTAFYKRNSLTSVTIPDSVTKIGDAAFSDCSNLTSVPSRTA